MGRGLFILLAACGSLPLTSAPDSPALAVTQGSVSDAPLPVPPSARDAGPCSFVAPQDFLLLVDLTGPNEDQGDGEDGSTAAYLPFVTQALVGWLSTIPASAPFRFSFALMALPDGGQAGLGLPWGGAVAAAAYAGTLISNPAFETTNEPAASYDALVTACEGGFIPWSDAGRNVLLFTHDDGEGVQTVGTVVQACSGAWGSFQVGSCEEFPFENLFIFSDASGYGFQNTGLTPWTAIDYGLVKSVEIMALELNLVLDCG